MRSGSRSRRTSERLRGRRRRRPPPPWDEPATEPASLRPSSGSWPSSKRCGGRWSGCPHEASRGVAARACQGRGGKGHHHSQSTAVETSQVCVRSREMKCAFRSRGRCHSDVRATAASLSRARAGSIAARLARGFGAPPPSHAASPPPPRLRVVIDVVDAVRAARAALGAGVLRLEQQPRDREITAPRRDEDARRAVRVRGRLGVGAKREQHLSR